MDLLLLVPTIPTRTAALVKFNYASSAYSIGPLRYESCRRIFILLEPIRCGVANVQPCYVYYLSLVWTLHPALCHGCIRYHRDYFQVSTMVH